MSVLIFLVVSYILLSVSLFFLFQKTDVAPIKGLIPGVQFTEWCKLIGRSPMYALWLLFPIVNIFIFTGMAVDLVRSFGKLKFVDSALAVIYAPASFFKIAFSDDKYEGAILPREKAYQEQYNEAVQSGDKYKAEKLEATNPFRKTVAREWTESIVFAVFAASFIRMFLIEAYIIPTGSMEGSLLVGDFLFVSKVHYGIRTPQTIASFPLLHNVIPIVGSESYSKKPQLPYKRLPKITPVKLNDPFVFNWPAGDSVYLTSNRSFSAEQARNPMYLRQNAELRREVQNGNLRVRPADKTDFYIKRCVGLPGDTLAIKNRQIYINGVEAENPEHMQHNYVFAIPQTGFNVKPLEKHGITLSDMRQMAKDTLIMALDKKQAEIVKDRYPNTYFSVQKNTVRPLELFPNDPKNFNQWTLDDFGPIYIPAKGETVTITPNNLALYRRIINTYEKNDLKIQNGRIIINGKPTTKYTFKQDYYWAVGDNRHASEDSRFWGFVPEDHIVGKPLFIWMSLKDGSLAKGVRWSRIFKSAND